MPETACSRQNGAEAVSAGRATSLMLNNGRSIIGSIERKCTSNGRDYCACYSGVRGGFVSTQKWISTCSDAHLYITVCREITLSTYF